jgi:hypothetical protein
VITNPDTAKHVSELMLDIGARLDESVALVMDQSPAEEFTLYRRAVGHIMAEILLEVLNPLYLEHPGLKPKEFD